MDNKIDFNYLLATLFLVCESKLDYIRDIFSDDKKIKTINNSKNIEIIDNASESIKLLDQMIKICSNNNNN